MAGLRPLLALVLATAACAGEPLRIVIAPRTTLAATAAVLSQLARLEGDPALVARLSHIPVITLSGLRPLRIEEPLIRAALARAGYEGQARISGAGELQSAALRIEATSLIAAASAALDPAGDEVAVSVRRPPDDLVVPDPGQVPTLIAESLDRNPAATQVPMRVRVMSGDHELARTLVLLEVRRWRRVVILTAPLARGAAVDAADLRQERIEVSRVHRDALTDPASLLGLQALRELPAGTVLTKAHLAVPPEVIPGRPVILVFRRDGLELSTGGESLGVARLGDQVQVRRSHDGAVLKGRVSRRDEVEIGF